MKGYRLLSHGIDIASISQAKRRKRRGYDAVISLEDPTARSGRQLRFHMPGAPPHLVIKLEDLDVAVPGVWHPSREDVERGILFARTAECGNPPKTILIHCQQGIARSTAMAFAVICDRGGPGSESDALSAVFQLRPEAIPNRLMVELADKILQRGGRMVSALDEHEPRLAAHREARLNFFLENRGLYARRTSR